MKDWGLAHRFAGSGDRAAIAGLLYDALRRKSSSAWLLGEATPRAEVLGALKQLRGLGVDEIAALFTGEGHAPPPLADVERERLSRADLVGAPAHVAGDYPEWLAPAFAESFGAEAAEAGRALAERAPVDLRVNVLKSSRDKALAALAHLLPVATPFSPIGLRIAVRADGRGAGAFGGAGLCERPRRGAGRRLATRDAAVRRQARPAGAGPLRRRRRQDARAGGNDGQPGPDLRDRHGRAPPRADLQPAGAFGRAQRAGARPARRAEILRDLEGRCDLVFVDAPCSGSGAWRRSPDAKWRMRPGALEQRIKDQIETLETAARYVKPGGRIVYVTCSVLEGRE